MMRRRRSSWICRLENSKCDGSLILFVFLQLNSIVFLQEKVGQVGVLFLSFTKFAVLVGSFQILYYKSTFFCVCRSHSITMIGFSSFLLLLLLPGTQGRLDLLMHTLMGPITILSLFSHDFRILKPTEVQCSEWQSKCSNTCMWK